MMQRTLDTPRGPIVLRTTTAADAMAMRELRLEGLRTASFAFGSSFEEESQLPDDEYTRRAARGDGTESQATFVLDDSSGRLGGMTGILRGTRLKDSHSATIVAVYIRPAWRGLRLSDALIESCVTWATERGVKIVRLGVATTNMPALACYRRCGFETTGIDPMAIYCDGTYHDEYMMSRVLDPSLRR
jgi:ribosomal protein S18 acetylase RimI-like enzyme